MSTIKSSDEHLTLNADGSSKDIKFQANGVEKASISSAGAFTSTTIDATKLTGNLPAISGAALTGVGVDGIVSNADATAITIDSNEKVGIGTASIDERLHVEGNDHERIQIESTVAGDAVIIHKNTVNYWKVGATASIGGYGGDGKYSIADGNDIRFAISPTNGEITNTSGIYNTSPTSTTATGWNFNNGGATITCTQNTAVKIGDCGASGMLIINDTTLNGQINILLTGAGAFTFLGASTHFVNSSSPNTSQVGFYRDSNQIYVKNGKSSTVQLGLLTFRTRNAQ